MSLQPCVCLWLLWLVALVSSHRPVYGQATEDFAQRNLDTIKKIYNTTIYPNNQAFAAQGAVAIPRGLFNTNASGRISPVGNFTGFEDSVEYFFGLTPVPQAPLWDTWTSFEIRSFTSGCPEVASSVVYGKTTGVNPNASSYGQHITTIKQVVFWRFDDAGSVIYYDAWIPNLKSYALLQFGVTPSPAVNAASIEQLCSRTQKLCTGTNAQYASTTACMETLSAKPYGDWDEVWGDNVVCRTLHIMLARLRPAVHCPHVGATGGGKCVDVKYNDVYFDDKELFGSTDTFLCPSSVRNITSSA